jgi:sugar phosphate isomerase/epimerase
MRLGAVTRALMAERTPEAQAPEALFAAAAQLGLAEFELPSRGWDEPGARFVERVNELQHRHRIGVSLNFGDDYVTHGADQPIERFERFVTQLCRPLGVTTIGTVSPSHGGRWLKDPPLSFQLERLAAALKRLAPVAEANGVKLAVENHADYRGHELASVLERVGSPAVGAKLDTGNALAALEDATDAAQALAPFTFATHVKDVRVESEPGNRGLELRGLCVMLEVGLGEGHVDFPTVLALLAKHGPLGNDLTLTIEEGARTIAASVAYARQHWAEHLGP